MYLYVVTGPPCSGKTTMVADNREPYAVVLDLDALAHALGYPTEHIEWGTPIEQDHPARDLARQIRTRLVAHAVQARAVEVPASAPAAETWIIDADPHPATRRYYDEAGALTIDLDPGESVCNERAAAAGRSIGTHDAIEEWYGRRRQAGRRTA